MDHLIQRFGLPVLVIFWLCAGVSALWAQDSASVPDTQALIDLLEDPASRDALIESLKNLASKDATIPTSDEPAASIGQQIAVLTSGALEATAASLQSAVVLISRIPEAFSGLSSEQATILIEAFRSVLTILVVTVATYLLLRHWGRRIFRNLNTKATGAGVIRSLVALIAKVFIDVLMVICAWGAGYLVGLFGYGETGEIGVRQSLYLNAFLIVGLVRVALRAVLSPRYSELRFVPVSDIAAKRANSWFGAIVTILGYGQLLIVPIVGRQASMQAARGISTLISFVAVAIAVYMVIRWRRAVAEWLSGGAEHAASGVQRVLAGLWHIPVLLYLLGLAVIVATRPDGVIWPVLINSARVLAVIVGAIVLFGAINRLLRGGISVPAPVARHLPTLKSRLDGAVPPALYVVRVAIVLFVALFALDAMGALDLGALLATQTGTWLVGALVSVAFILVFGFLFWLVLVSWVDFRLNPNVGTTPSAREATLLTLMKNAVTVVLVIIIVMFVLSELGVNIAPLIASAGVLGLAIGFGAQKLVQDIITGIFIQFENVMNVGDVVTLGGTTGTVEKLTIRSVSLRDVQGAFHVIPFSSVDMVTNFVKGYGFFVCDLGIGYREKVEDGKAAMFDAFAELREGEHGPSILDDLQWFGVQSLGDSAVVLRARIKCAPGQQWSVGRAYNEICKRIMDERGIEIPFPHQTLYFGEDRSGKAPPLRIARTGAE